MGLKEYGQVERLIEHLTYYLDYLYNQADDSRWKMKQAEEQAKGVLVTRNEYLQEFVISELLRLNLECCTVCGNIIEPKGEPLTHCSIYDPLHPARGILHRVCRTCLKSRSSLNFPTELQVCGENVDIGEYLTTCGRLAPDSTQLFITTLPEHAVRAAFEQLKTLAQKEALSQPADA